jgi:hypothetical protein
MNLPPDVTASKPHQGKTAAEYLRTGHEETKLFSAGESQSYLGIPREVFHQLIRQRKIRPAHGVDRLYVSQSELDRVLRALETRELELPAEEVTK